MTKKLKEILKIIDVKVLDHIIVGDDVTSFTDSSAVADCHEGAHWLVVP